MRTAITEAFSYEGPAYAVLVEDGFIYRCDHFVACLLPDGRQFSHATAFLTKDDADRLAARIMTAGNVDLALWTEAAPHEPYTLEEERGDEELSWGRDPRVPLHYRVETFID